MINVPDTLDFIQAASIPEAWITSYQLLIKVAKLKKNETALILAAASGVGTCMI